MFPRSMFRIVARPRRSSRLLAVILILGSTSAVFAEPRTAKVAGAFYPSDPQELRALITRLLDQYPAPDPPSAAPRILILPHAGYAYSGPVAARGIREIQGRRQDYDGVVVVAFTHREPFEGVSVDDRDAYRTPLGDIAVDIEAVAFLKSRPKIRHVERAHDSDEHSLEAILPFLQVAWDDVRLVPILMGGIERSDAETLANALALLAARRRYLFIFSTDLSHYHPYDQAVQRDEATIHAILFETGQAVDRLFSAGAMEACGRGPITTALLLAQRLGYPQRRLLAHANSGDTTVDKSRVVGYAAVGMYESPDASSVKILSPEAGEKLVEAARRALNAHFRPDQAAPHAPPSDIPELAQARGLFVTLRQKTGELRGCIGRIQTDTSLAESVPVVALDAALRDERFQPVAAGELDDLTVEVSVLSPPQPIRSPQEIVAGRDGVVLQKDGRSGVFLPQVWDETGWTRVEFLRELAHQKAGLDPDAWKDAQLFVFQDQEFGE